MECTSIARLPRNFNLFPFIVNAADNPAISHSEVQVETIAILSFINPLSPNSDQHHISPCNINAYSTQAELMRIKDMITQGQHDFLGILLTSPQYFNKKSIGTRWENLFFDIWVKGLSD